MYPNEPSDKVTPISPSNRIDQLLAQLEQMDHDDDMREIIESEIYLENVYS
tara:strand:+ start:558 stop:710 length:153 start_codon:yes stop_codon:yes gene_type:complete